MQFLRPALIRSIPLLLFAFATFAVAVVDGFRTRSPRQFTQEAYLWQQRWNNSVTVAVEQVQAELSGLAILAATIRFEKDQPVVARVALPLAFLAGRKLPWAPVFRLSSASSSFSSTAADEEVREISRQVEELIGRGAGHFNEIQLDFDCPTSKLGGYAILLSKLKQRIPGKRWTITILPSWLSSKQWPALLKECDAFVLQLHSLDLPEATERFLDLCDVDRSKKWVQAASRFGRPFRVALPTYRSDVLFDQKGTVVAVSSESGIEGESYSRSVAWSRPEILVPFVKWLQDSQPLVQGILWFRLPVETDRKNWSRHTFTAVLQGRLPTRGIKVEAAKKGADLYLLELQNQGEKDELLPNRIEVSWEDPSTESADGLGPYELTTKTSRSLAFQLREEAAEEVPTFAAGENLSIGWVRAGDSTDKVKFTIK